MNYKNNATITIYGSLAKKLIFNMIFFLFIFIFLKKEAYCTKKKKGKVKLEKNEQGYDIR